MNRRFLLGFIALVYLACLEPASAEQSFVNVATYHDDNLRTGWNPRETLLTTRNVNPFTFGVRYQVALDDQVDGQPLVVNGIVYVATENNTVYAIDAATGAVITSRNLGLPVYGDTVPAACVNHEPKIGIQSTPVIDVAQNVMYVVSSTWENAEAVYRIHELALSNLAEIDNKIIRASGTSIDEKTLVAFDARYQRQRAGLLEANGNVYAAFSSACDPAGKFSRGWVLGWQAGTLSPLPANELADRNAAARSASPPTSFQNRYLTSISMSGYGLASDLSGDLFFTTESSGASPPDNLRGSAVRLSSDLTTLDGLFKPRTSLSENKTAGFGSGGLMALPAQPDKHPDFAVAAGEDGILYVLNRDFGKLGGDVSGGADGTFSTKLGACWCGPSYFEASDGVGRVVTSQGAALRTYKVDATAIDPLILEASASMPESIQAPGFFTFVSSNGVREGSAIIWAVERPTSKAAATVTLSAYSAEPTAGALPLLYSSPAGPWPNLNADANLVPVVAGGNVYVASYQTLTVFGLLSTQPPQATAASSIPRAPRASILPADPSSGSAFAPRTFRTTISKNTNDKNMKKAQAKLANSLGVGGYSLPPLVNQYAIAFGDSRTGNAGGATYNSPGFAQELGYGNGYPGWLLPLSGNALLAEASFNYGVGAQSSAGIAGRLNSTGIDCNDVSSGAAICVSGTRGTISGSLSAGSTSILMNFVGGATPSSGDYVNVNGGNVLYSCQSSGLSGSGPYTITVPSSCITGKVSSGSIILLSHPANSSAFASYLPSGGIGATVTDVDKSRASTGLYSPVTDPAPLVFFLGNTNDANFRNVSQSIANDIAIFNALGPSGANKVVIAADEVPRGAAEGYSIPNLGPDGAPEVGTVGAAGSYTTHNASNYYDTQQVFFAPPGSGPPFVAGANDGLALTNCTTGTTTAPSGAAQCAPAPGQFSVSPSGVYTFNAADIGKAVAIFYRWKSNLGGAYLGTVHNWLQSTYCGSGVDPATGLAVQGAQCSGLYPWVHVAPTWEATVDSTTGPNDFPLPYISVDGLHPEPYGGAVISNAMLSAAATAGAIQSATPFPQPTVNNIIFTATVTASATTQISTCGAGTGGTTTSYFLHSLSVPVAILTVGAPLYFPTAASGLPNGATITCVDTSRGLVQMSNPATKSNSISTAIFEQADSTSLLGDGVFDYSNLTATSPQIANTGTPSLGTKVVKGAPAGWSFAIDANTANALAAGTIGLSYGIESNPLNDGYDDFVVVLQGYGPPNGSGTISLTESTNMKGIGSTFAKGDQHRAQCDIKISAGPNGHLTGIAGVLMKVSDNTTGYFVPPGLSSGAYNSWTSEQGSGSIDFADPLVAAGSPNVTGQGIYNAGTATAAVEMLDLPELSPPAQFAAAGSFSQYTAVAIGYTKGDPVSATVRIRRCWMGKVTQ